MCYIIYVHTFLIHTCFKPYSTFYTLFIRIHMRSSHSKRQLYPRGGGGDFYSNNLSKNIHILHNHPHCTDLRTLLATMNQTPTDKAGFLLLLIHLWGTENCYMTFFTAVKAVTPTTIWKIEVSWSSLTEKSSNKMPSLSLKREFKYKFKKSLWGN